MKSRSLQHELIRASAGAGKTYALTNRYLQLLRLGQRPDGILASTFTRKAAGEITGRVLLRLAQAATDSVKLAELRGALHDETLSHTECLTLLSTTASQLHRLRIGTLDSFFSQLAGSFVLELGLPPGWRIAEEHEDRALRERATEAVLDNEEPASLLTLVHAMTRGETTRSLEREVRDKIATLYEVYLDSSSEAWHKLVRRRELPEPQLAAAIDVLRAVPLPRHKNWEKRREQDVATAEQGDWSKFIEGGIAAKIICGETSFYSKSIEPPVAAAYRPLIDHAAALMVNQLANQTEATYRLLDKFHHQYQKLKARTRALRFDDITFQLARKVYSLLGESEAGRDLFGFRLDAHLDHLLLDEFQDTSLTQWSVLRLFAQRVSRGAANRSFFCVGDAKQAIYGWRGGVAQIFDAVNTELKDIHQRPLDTSWRSSPQVVGAVNLIFQNLQRHENLDELAGAVVEWQKQFNDHHTAEPKLGLNGYVCLQAARTADDDEGDTGEQATLRFAAEQVAQWRNRAPGFEIGVLVRRNDAVRRLIYELRELNVEASEEGGASLDDSAAVRVVLSLMQFADHPGDLVARLHIASSPLAKSLDLFEVSAGGSGSRHRWDDDARAALAFSSRRGDAAAGRLSRQIRRRLLDDGYGATVHAFAEQLAAACTRRESRRLEKLIGLAYQYDGVATTRPSGFVAYVDAARVRDPVAADVRVMTVHQAKGLEFDIVVLADLDKNLLGQRDDLVAGRLTPTSPIDRVCRRCGKEVMHLLPDDWQSLFLAADNRNVAESLCVLYVAVTRAIHALHMIIAPSPANERRLPKTYAGLLRAAVAGAGRLDSGQIAYETGDKEWFKSPGRRHTSTPDGAAQRGSPPPAEVKLPVGKERRWRGLQRVSPSGLEGGTHVRLVDQWTESGTDRSAALARGTLIHAWFEQIVWLDDGSPGDDLLRDVAGGLPELGLSAADIDRLLAEFRTMLRRPQIAACLRRNAYDSFSSSVLKVENERPIAVRLGDQLLAGTVDRLVTVNRGNRLVAAEILDFKTDVFAADDPSVLDAKADFYRPQLQAYRRAVSAMLRMDSEAIAARLLFVHSGITVRI